MLALSPSTFPNLLWPVEEPLQQHYFPRDITDQTPSFSTTPVSSNPDHVTPPQPEFLESASFASDPEKIKKLNHNASERDRRKMMNNLYSSLRSLLPASDHTKKLSIPATVSRVLQYIPELQQQVERLSERKEKLVAKIYKENQLMNQQKKFTKIGTDVPVVSTTKLTETEVVIEICAIQQCPISEILLILEVEEGLSLINCSSFQSFEGRIFYTLHLKAEGTNKLECEGLTEKLVCLYETRNVLFP